MITSMSFMHLRGLAGLAKQCRNKMINLRKILIKLPEITKTLEKAEQEGDIDETQKDLLEFINLLAREEEDRKVIEQDEFKIELDEVNKELEEKKKLVELIETLKRKGGKVAESARFLENEKNEFEKIIQYSKQSIKELVGEELDMLRNRESRVKYMRIMGDKYQAAKSYRDMVDEIKKLRADKKIHDNILELYYKIESALSSKNDQELEEHVNKLVEALKIESEIRKYLFTDIANSLHFLHLIYSHLLQVMDEQNPNGLLQGHIKKDTGEGYPEQKMAPVEERYHEVAKVVDKDKIEIFKMSRWLGYEVQSGDSQTA